MAKESIDVLLAEKRTFPPSSEFSKKAHIKDLSEYEKIYSKSVEDPDGFWAEMAEKQLDNIIAERVPKGMRCERVVLFGKPFVEILRYAKEQNADMIVMATHGRGAISHLLMGSTAEKVVRKAPCPVLTVKHPKHVVAMP